MILMGKNLMQFFSYENRFVLSVSNHTRLDIGDSSQFGWANVAIRVLAQGQ